MVRYKYERNRSWKEGIANGNGTIRPGNRLILRKCNSLQDKTGEPCVMAAVTPRELSEIQIDPLTHGYLGR